MGRRGRPARRPREEGDDMEFAVALAPRTRDERRFSRGRGGRRGGAQHAAPGRGRGKQSEYFSEPGESSSSCSDLEDGFEALGSDEELISRFLRTSLASPLQPGGSEDEASASSAEEDVSSEQEGGSSEQEDGSGEQDFWNSDDSLSEWEAEVLIRMAEEGVESRRRRLKTAGGDEGRGGEDKDPPPGPPTLASQFPIYSRPLAPPRSKKSDTSGKKAARDRESPNRKKESRRLGIEARRAARASRKEAGFDLRRLDAQIRALAQGAPGDVLAVPPCHKTQASLVRRLAHLRGLEASAHKGACGALFLCVARRARRPGPEEERRAEEVLARFEAERASRRAQARGVADAPAKRGGGRRASGDARAGDGTAPSAAQRRREAELAIQAMIDDTPLEQRRRMAGRAADEAEENWALGGREGEPWDGSAGEAEPRRQRRGGRGGRQRGGGGRWALAGQLHAPRASVPFVSAGALEDVGEGGEVLASWTETRVEMEAMIGGDAGDIATLLVEDGAPGLGLAAAPPRGARHARNGARPREEDSQPGIAEGDFAYFERHTMGIGSKLMAKWGFGGAGAGLGSQGQGRAEPILPERRQKKQGLGAEGFQP